MDLIKDLTPNEVKLMVLLEIECKGEVDGLPNCRRSKDKLIESTGYSRSTFFRTFESLVEKGFVIIGSGVYWMDKRGFRIRKSIISELNSCRKKSIRKNLKSPGVFSIKLNHKYLVL